MLAASRPQPTAPSSPSSAREERRKVNMHGYAMFEDGTSHPIEVLDLSYEGCGIETPVDLANGQRVKLSVLRRGAIDAEVRWYRDGKAGLVFTPTKAPPKQHWPRRTERHVLGAEVTMRRIGHNNFRLHVLDASPDGCKVELVERPRLEEHVLVKFDGLEALDSEVMWVDGFTAGLRFTKPMHPAVFDLLVTRLKG